MLRAIATLYLLLVLPAGATVYRCEVAGRPVFTDQPCAAGATPHGMEPLNTLPAAGDADLAKAHDARAEKERRARDKNDAAWLKSHEAAKKREVRMSAAVADKRVLKDMNRDEVRRALGSPDEVERHQGREHWIYGSGKKRQIVVIENGRVVKIPSKMK